MTVADRLWSRVAVPDDPDACWEFQGAVSNVGYGVIGCSDNTVTYTHRLAYELLVGPIPEGLHIDHLCRNRRCCNVIHLEPVSQRENNLRGESPAAHNARKTHCLRGHEFTSANTYRPPGRTDRQCRACIRIRQRRNVEKVT